MVTGYQCVFEEYAKDNNYARFNTCNYHSCREEHFNVIFCYMILCHMILLQASVTVISNALL